MRTTRRVLVARSDCGDHRLARALCLLIFLFTLPRKPQSRQPAPAPIASDVRTYAFRKELCP